MPLIKFITCSECDFKFKPLSPEDTFCPDCFHENEKVELKLDKKKKPIDAFISMFPPDEEGITWEVVPSPYKPYKEGV